MGLRQGLRHITSTRRRAALLDPSLQLASAACQYRIRATHQHPWLGWEQPVEAPHLELNCGGPFPRAVAADNAAYVGFESFPTDRRVFKIRNAYSVRNEDWSWRHDW